MALSFKGEIFLMGRPHPLYQSSQWSRVVLDLFIHRFLCQDLWFRFGARVAPGSDLEVVIVSTVDFSHFILSETVAPEFFSFSEN